MQFGKDNHELMVGGNENEILRVNLDTGNLTSVSYDVDLFMHFIS